MYESLDAPARALLDAPDEKLLQIARDAIPNAGMAYSVAKRAVILLTMRLAAEPHERKENDLFQPATWHRRPPSLPTDN